MIIVVTIMAVAIAASVGVAVAVRATANPRQTTRLGGLAIVCLVAVLLTPLVARDSGWPAVGVLLGLPVGVAVLPLLTQRQGRLARVTDLAVAAALGAWGLALALGGIGVAILPAAALYLLAGLIGGPASSQVSTNR